MAASLIGRDQIIGELEAVLSGAVAGAGGALLLHGPAGIGKSALLSHATKHAARAGALVLTAAGVQTEYAFGFALLGQLLRPVAAEAADLNTLLRDAATPYAVAQATLELVTTLAERSPVVLVVDDLHWVDSFSATVLSFLGRRIGSDPVAVLGAFRDDATVSTDATFDGLPAVSLPSLAPAEAEQMLRTFAPALNPAARHRILQEAGGNPLALTELARVTPRLGATSTPGGLELTQRLERTFAERVATLPPPTRLSLLVAALGDEQLDDVLSAAGAVAGRPVDAADLEPAVIARLIEPTGGGRSVRFRHPLIRSAIRQAAAGSDRRACHRALAATTSDRPERNAWHRAAATDEPDEQIAANLELAAKVALGRGGAAAAHAMLLRAADLTVEPNRRQQRLMGALTAAADMGDTPEIGRLVEIIEPQSLDVPSQLVLALFREAYIENGWSGAQLITGIGDAAAVLPPGTDLRQAFDSVSQVATRIFWGAGPDDPLRGILLDIVDRLPVAADDPRRLLSYALLAPVDRGAAVLSLSQQVNTSATDPIGLFEVGLAAQIVGDLSLSARLLSSATTALRSSSLLRVLVEALTSQSLVALLLGDVRLAAACAEEATRLAPEIGLRLFAVAGQALGAAAAGLRGDLATSEALTTRAESVLVPMGAIPMLALVRLARGLTALGQSRPHDAYEEMVAVFTPAAAGSHFAFRLMLVQPLTEAAVRAGRQDEIRPLLAELTRVGEQTHAPALLAGLRYADAVLSDDDATFHQGLTAVGLTALDRAHLELAYGQSLRRRRRVVESRTHLRSALRTYDALGLVPWSETARAQLRASGERVDAARTDAADLLTPQELHIAALAARGLTNREIAQRLYASHRTIGAHLYHIYPKLGITSRLELAQALGPAMADYTA